MLDYILIFIVYFPGLLGATATNGSASFMTLEDCHKAGVELIEKTSMVESGKMSYICVSRGEN